MDVEDGAEEEPILSAEAPEPLYKSRAHKVAALSAR